MGERKSGMPREHGISRRELLKRGAVVGGTLVWAVPVLQSLAPPAFAQYAMCGCCYCWNGDKQNPTPNDRDVRDLVQDNGCLGRATSPQTCADFCSGDAEGQGPFAFSEQCCGTNLCDGNTQNDPGTNGCFCS